MLFLGHESAAQYWRTARAGLIPFPKCARADIVYNEVHLIEEVIELKPDLPIENQELPHILVSDKRLTHASDDAFYHVCAKRFPAGSFYQHTQWVAIASPELTLLQAAQDLGNQGLITLLELCCEFMGCYSLNDGDRRGFTTCDPLVTRKQMREYIDKLPKWMRGKRLLGNAIELAGENSRSPRETECFLAFSLSPELGGFGLSQPKMNLPTARSDDQGESADKQYYLVDLAWKEGNVVFEYDGTIDHSEPEKVRKDKERRSELASQGKAVIVGVKESVGNDGSFRDKAAQVFRALDIPWPEFNETEMREQSRLRAQLFDPTHHSLQPYIKPIVPKNDTLKGQGGFQPQSAEG